MLNWCINRRFVGTASLGKGLGEGRRSCINKKHRISIIQTKNIISCHELRGIQGRFMGKKSFAGWRHTNHDLGNPWAERGLEQGCPVSWLLPCSSRYVHYTFQAGEDQHCLVTCRLVNMPLFSFSKDHSVFSSNTGQHNIVCIWFFILAMLFCHSLASVVVQPSNLQVNKYIIAGGF